MREPSSHQNSKVKKKKTTELSSKRPTGNMATSITYRNCDDQTVDKAWANPKATLLWSSRMRKRGKSGVRQSM